MNGLEGLTHDLYDEIWAMRRSGYDVPLLDEITEIQFHQVGLRFDAQGRLCRRLMIEHMVIGGYTRFFDHIYRDWDQELDEEQEAIIEREGTP